MKSRMKSALVALALSLGVTMGVGVPMAHAALSFGTTTVPGSLGQGKGSWTIDRTNGTRVKVAGQTRDLKPGGNSIYWNANLQSSSGYCPTFDGQVSCSLEWHNQTTLQGTRFNSSAWKSSTKYNPVQMNSKSQRVGLKTCEEVRWWVDPCSAHSWTNGRKI